MKALTIDQPFSHLICGLDPGDPRQKRVENRNHDRFRNHRGLLLIHAGLTKRRLVFGGITGGGNGHQPELYGLDPKTLPLGAIVGAVDMVSHFKMTYLTEQFGHYSRFIGKEISPGVLERFPWLKDHQHVEGPYCLTLENIRKFREPIPCKGAQGIWNLPAELEERVKEQLQKAEALP